MTTETKYPSKIECTSCHRKYGVRPDVYEARIEKFGSEENLLANYICRRCQKAQGVDSHGEERGAPATHSSAPYDREYHRKREMASHLSLDPFDNTMKAWWQHKSYLDSTEGKFYERMLEDIEIYEKTGTFPPFRDNLTKPGQLIYIPDICWNPPFAIAHKNRCKTETEKCSSYKICGLRVRGGPTEGRKADFECSDCGEWVDDSAFICPGCSARFDEE